MKRLIYLLLLLLFILPSCNINEKPKKNQKEEKENKKIEEPTPGTTEWAKFSGTRVKMHNSLSDIVNGKSNYKILYEDWSVTFDYPFIYVNHKNNTTKFYITTYNKKPKELYEYWLRNTEDGSEWLIQWYFYGVQIDLLNFDNSGEIYLFLLNEGENIKFRIN